MWSYFVLVSEGKCSILYLQQSAYAVFHSLKWVLPNIKLIRVTKWAD